MHFSVQKKIIQKKQSPLKGLVNVLILTIAIPVIIIAGISLSLYFLFLWLKNKIFKEKIIESAEDNYYLELDLIYNEHVHIILIEDEFDIELTQLNNAWQENVYNEETCLYRTRTIPLIPALEGGITCFYFKEQYNGLFLQVLPIRKNNKMQTLHTQLIFIDYEKLDLTLIDETGPFFLYNDDKNVQQIKGFNKEEELTLELLPTSQFI
jgi:hypothetical protein